MDEIRQRVIHVHASFIATTDVARRVQFANRQAALEAEWNNAYRDYVQASNRYADFSPSS